MSYPIYIGQNPRHLVEDTKAIVNGSKIPTLKSASDFGNQMICIANYFLTKEIRETGRNTGQFIDEWNREFANNDEDFDKQSAWCTIFIWKLANEAAKTLYCENPLPDYKAKFRNPQTNKEEMIWGNARNTVEYLKQIGVKITKSTPVPGCMMFRNSKSASSSGHWGIVTDVTKDKFRTIEGNITLSDGSDGVGYWEYDNSEIINPQSGILFAHVQEFPNCKMELKPYNGFACPVEKLDTPKTVNVTLPKCIKKQGDNYFYVDANGNTIALAQQLQPGKWYIMGLKAGEGWVDVTNCDYEYKSPVVETTPTKKDEIAVKDYSPSKDTNTPIPEKVKKCKNVIVAVPPTSRLQHYSVLRDKVVLADITGANFSGVSSSRRNGAALWYNHTDKIDPKTHTGFGMFRDNLNNSIFFLDANQPQSADILRTGFLGYSVDDHKNLNFPDSANYLQIYLTSRKYYGDGWIERFTNDLASSQIEFGGLEKMDPTMSTARVWMPDNSNLNHKVNFRTLGEKNLFGYLKEIENRSIKLDSPLVIVINERTAPPHWTDKISQIIAVATTVTSLVGIPIPAGVINRTKQFVKVLSGEEKLTGDVLLEGLQMAAQLAEYYAPETVKGVNKFADDIKTEIGGFLKKGLDSVTPYFATNMDINNINVLKQVQNTLGLDIGEIEKLFNKYKTTSPFGKSIDLTKIVGDVGLSDLNKTVENISNMFMLDTMSRHLRADGGLVSDIIKSANPIADVPIIQDLFASSGSNSVLSTFPKIQEMTNELLGHGAIRQIINGEVNAPDIKAALIGQVFGNIPVDKDILKPLQLAALSSKAAAHSRAGDPFVLPDSISEEYKECYKFYIETDMNVPVIYCPTGWNWDKQLKKCVNPNAKVGYKGNTTSSNNNGNVTGGQLPTEKINIELPKEEKKVSTGPGFDFGRDTGFANTNLDLNFDILKKTSNPEIEIGKPLPVDFIPPCLVKEGNNYYYYPYGMPKVSNVEIVTQRPSEKVLTVLPKDLPTSPITSSPTYSGGIKPITPSLPKEIITPVVPSGNITPLNIIATLPSGGVPTFKPGYDLAMPLPTLNDLPEKILVYKSGNKWVALINGKQYDFDPINCKIIGYQEPYKEENDEKIVSKKDLENEIAKREQERQEAEKKIREEAELRKQQAIDQAKEIENQKRLNELRRQNELLIEQNKKLQTEVVKEAKATSNTEEMNKLVDIINLERKRANEALVQLNAERTKGTDDTAFQKQLEEMRNNILQEQNRNNALRQEIEILKNKPVQTVTTATPVTVPTPVNNANCTDCDKLGMPKIVEKHEKITYGFPEQNCHSCPQCGGCDDECDCY